MSRFEMIQLGSELDASGFAGRELAIRSLVRQARAAGVASVAADVLADIAAPDVARLRAFAAVSAALVRVESVPTPVAAVA